MLISPRIQKQKTTVKLAVGLALLIVVAGIAFFVYRKFYPPIDNSKLDVEQFYAKRGVNIPFGTAEKIDFPDVKTKSEIGLDATPKELSFFAPPNPANFKAYQLNYKDGSSGYLLDYDVSGKKLEDLHDQFLGFSLQNPWLCKFKSANLEIPKARYEMECGGKFDLKIMLSENGDLTHFSIQALTK